MRSFLAFGVGLVTSLVLVGACGKAFDFHICLGSCARLTPPVLVRVA